MDHSPILSTSKSHVEIKMWGNVGWIGTGGFEFRVLKSPRLYILGVSIWLCLNFPMKMGELEVSPHFSKPFGEQLRLPVGGRWFGPVPPAASMDRPP